MEIVNENKSIELNEVAGNSWIEILREGEFENSTNGEKIKITEDMLDKMINNYYNNVRGIMASDGKPTLDIDVEHTRDAKYGKDAVGWYGELEKGKKELQDGRSVTVLKMKPKSWTTVGQDLIKNGVKKFFSVDFRDEWTNPDTNKKYDFVLFGGSLTNRPAVKELSPITLSEGQKVKTETENFKKEKSKMEKLKEALKLSGVNFSETSTAELIEDKAIEKLKYFAEKVASIEVTLAEVTKSKGEVETKLAEAMEKVAKIELAELASKKDEVNKLAKKKISVKELSDANSWYNILLAEGKFSELKVIIDRLPIAFKEKAVGDDGEGDNETPDGDEGQETAWENLDNAVKNKKVLAYMAEKQIPREKFREAEVATSKEHNAKVSKNIYSKNGGK